jgi:hypothetical protein
MSTPEFFTGSATIVKEIYDAVLRLTGRVDTLIAQHDETRTDLKDHEVRIRALERNRWPLPSLAVLLSAGALILAAIKQFGT